MQALEEAIARYGWPDILNCDQGAGFTRDVFTGVLKSHATQISMDCKSRGVDTVFFERLWHSMKYEQVYLQAYESVAQPINRLW
jgi:putative transposase